MQQLSLFAPPQKAESVAVAPPDVTPDHGVIRVERHVSHCSRFNRPAKWLHVKITVWRGKTRCVAEIPALSTRVEAAGMVQLCDKVADALEPLAVKHLQISPKEIYFNIQWIDAAIAQKTRALSIGRL